MLMVFETPLDGNEEMAAALGRLVGKWGALEHLQNFLGLDPPNFLS
jgi:hypothetical protein